jgi:Protein kinase domain
MAFALGKLEEARIEVLHEHLDACATCQFVVADAAHALAVAVTTPLAAEPAAEWNTMFARGTLVGRRYVIQRFVARGGMGEVYEAFDRELQERVALKTVTSTLSDDARAVKRLKAEVQLARRVSHPNVCRIYDLGTHFMPGVSGQLHFLTMQFVDGETLGQRVRLAGALPPDEASKIARELLVALRAAHEADVLHRDLKSDNVLLRAEPDGQSTAVVLDFGLARALDQEPPPSASNPNLVGTVGYIAPEQFEGRAYTIASDIFSFGVVWYEMLTGQMPFEAASKSRVTPVKPPGSVPAPSSINPFVSNAFDPLVLKCLARAPEDRFRSVGELLDAFDAVMDGPSVRRRRTALAATLLGTAAAAAAAYFLVHGSGDSGSSVLAREVVPVGTQRPDAPDIPHTAPPVSSATAPPLVALPTTIHAEAPPPVTVPGPRRRSFATNGTQPVTVPTPPVAPIGSTAQVAPTDPAATAVPDTPRAGSVPLPKPAPLPPQKKPDWENPFGAADTPELIAGSKTAT